MSFATLWGYGRATILAATLAAAPALAQMSPDPSSGSDQFRQGSQYNQGTETTLEGTVVSVNPQTPTGQHVILDTSQGQYDVHLGPQWFLQQQQASLQPGERIQVTGSEQTINGQPSLIARQVTENGNTITLRTNSGIPLWSGASRRGFQTSSQGQFSPYTPEQENPLMQGANGQQGTLQTGPYTSQPGMYGQPGQFQQFPSQQGPYAGQQGQFQQPPFQQTPYVGQPGPFSQGPQQRQMSIANWQRGADIYNPFTETTLTGTVQQVKQCSCGPFSSTYAMLSTNQGKVAVQLAPAQYLNQNQLQINRGDQIQVIGSRLNVNGNDVLLARLVSTGQRTVALRSPQGMPQWVQTGQFGQQQQPGFTDGFSPSTDEPDF